MFQDDLILYSLLKALSYSLVTPSRLTIFPINIYFIFIFTYSFFVRSFVFFVLICKLVCISPSVNVSVFISMCCILVVKKNMSSAKSRSSNFAKKCCSAVLSFPLPSQQTSKNELVTKCAFYSFQFLFLLQKLNIPFFFCCAIFSIFIILRYS